MRGYPEESSELRARRELLDRARIYAGCYLINADRDGSIENLLLAAVAYVKTLDPGPAPRKRASPKRSGGKR